MLLQFSVSNYRSIKDKATISMKATKDNALAECVISPDGKAQLLPVIALYGANAAGKSNVLKAMLLMKDMVCGASAKPLKGGALPQEPFAFQEDTSASTSFEIIYYYMGIKYAYGYSFNKEKIVEEYLYHWPNGREALVFSRKDGQYEFRESIQEQTTLAGRTPDNRLYLVSSNEWNCKQTEKAYFWFQRNLLALTDAGMANDATLANIRKGNGNKNKVLQEMLLADLGICDVVLSGTKDQPTISTVHQLQENGQDTKYSLLLNQESMGTQRFFSRIGLWLDTMEQGAVLVVDEIETSMHPLLTRHLVEMIQDPLINKNHAQLIFTTHDTGLLDLTLLRRDQIWFAEKDTDTMQTDVYALTDYSPRKGENIAKGYLQGRYGAIPFVGGAQGWEE